MTGSTRGGGGGAASLQLSYLSVLLCTCCHDNNMAWDVRQTPELHGGYRAPVSSKKVKATVPTLAPGDLQPLNSKR